MCYRFQLNRVNKQQFETKHFTAIRSFDKFGWLREVSDRKKTNRTLSKRTYQSHLNIKSRNYLFPNHKMLEFMMTDNWTGLNKSIQLITISNHVTMFYYAGFHHFFFSSLSLSLSASKIIQFCTFLGYTNLPLHDISIIWTVIDGVPKKICLQRSTLVIIYRDMLYTKPKSDWQQQHYVFR